MSTELVFMMGKFEARVRVDRGYARNHMWCQAQPEDNVGAGDSVTSEAVTRDAVTSESRTGGGIRYRCGFSAYAVRLLQDVYFLEWTVEAGAAVSPRQAIGAIESSKAESDLFAPFSGRLAEFNGAVLADPSAINVDTYGDGWLFEITGVGDDLLSPPEYLEHLEMSWAVAQRTIKGQINEG